MSDRPNGMLTPIDREFLQAGGNYYDGETARQTRYQRRRGIRARITQTLLDFQYLIKTPESKLRQQIFNEPEKSGAEDRDEFDLALRALFYWLYRGCEETDFDFDRLLEMAVRQAAEDHIREESGTIVDVEVDLDIKVTSRETDLEDLSRRLTNGEPVATSEIYDLPKIGEFPIDSDEVDVVRIETSSHLLVDNELEIVDTILQKHLGIEAEIEVVGPTLLANVISQNHEGELTAAVPTAEYEP